MPKTLRIAVLLLCVTAIKSVSALDAEPPTITKADVFGNGLSLEFSEPMLTWFGSTAPTGVSVNPPLSCNWSWGSDTQLTCNNFTGVGPKAATTYHISVGGGLWSQQGQEVRSQVMSVDSWRPSVEEATILRWEDGQPVIDVTTNMPATEGSLHAALRLKVDASDVEFRLSANSESQGRKGTSWRLAFTPTEASARSLSLRVQPGLRAIEGELAGQQDEVLLRARVNEPFRLRLVGCSGDYRSDYTSHGAEIEEGKPAQVSIDCPAGQQLALEFSDAPSASSLELLRSHLPRELRFDKTDEAPFFPVRGYDKKEFARPGHFFRLIAERPDQTLEVQVPATLTSEGGTQIENSAAITIRSLDFLPRFAISPAQLLLPTGADSPHIFTMVNQPALELTQHEISADGPSSRTETIGKSPKNELAQKSPPDPQREVRKDGGLVVGSIKSPSRYGSYQNSYSIAYAAFNVTASKAGHQFMVWVTDWHQAAPIANAKVELLHVKDEKTTTVVATATTDSEGIAILDEPRGTEEERRANLLVRVSRGDQRSLMSLYTTLQRNRAREPEYRYDNLGEGEQVVWGVSDRPLYRPGDIVHYRLWVRERQLNHLRTVGHPGNMKFQLKPQYDNTSISDFSASLDPFGSAAGEIQLPTTLHDNNYCIAAASDTSYGTHGACFRVTGYRVNELWAELHVDHAVAREGDTVELNASAGYFSGGAAVGAKVELQSLLTPQRLEDAYPTYRAFTFIDPYESTSGSGGEGFPDAMKDSPRTDALGHSRHKAKLFNPLLQERFNSSHERPIPFGNLELTATVSSSASSWATAPASLKFTRYPRFVGLKVQPWLLRQDADPKVEAVVITDMGESVGDASVAIDVEEVLPSDPGTGNEQPKVLAHCDLRIGQSTSCPFRPQHSGRYRFHATSEGAAPASVVRYAFLGDTWKEDAQGQKASLFTENENPAAGTTAELVLRQPFAKAQVLFSIEHGRVLKHWVQRIDDHIAKVSVPMDAQWSPGVTINAVILDAADEAFGKHAPTGELVEMASIDLHLAGAASAPLSMVLDRTQVNPGDEIKITLRNPATTSRQVTLGVVDDAARALVPEFSEAMDPSGDAWLGKLRSWSVPDWYGLGVWARRVGDTSNSPQSVFDFFTNTSGGLETIVVTGSNIRAVDVFQRGSQSDHSLGRPPSASGSGKALRSHFADSAFWKTDLVLDAGAEKSINVRLPDNLTRWRVLAWSADQSDNFALSQATVQASLPIEVRNEVPLRLFPGDTTILGASVRAHGQAATITAGLKAQGAGISAATQWKKKISANAEQLISVSAQPIAVGKIDVEARASDGRVNDGVAAQVEVASPVVHQRVPVAGWLPADGVHLKMPALPTGATHARVRVEAGRGLIALAKSWIDALRDYPHRCWEQILSRAVGAAAATRLGLADSNWHDASAVVDEAMRAAGQFQDDGGQFHFFVGQYGAQVSPPSLYLTAYTLQSLAFLRDQGFTVPSEVEERARKALSAELAPQRGQPTSALGTRPYQIEELAAAAAATESKLQIRPDAIEAMWNGRAKLSWYGRSNLARVLGVRPQYEQRSREIVDELKQAGVKHGMGRRIEGKAPLWWPFYSSALDQCGALRALGALDHANDAADIRGQYMRGLADLYAGGAPVLDTHASAQCLMTLVELMPATSQLDEPVEFTLSGSDFAGKINLPPRQSSGEWTRDFPMLPAVLDVRANAKDALLSFVANVEYDLDGRHAQSAAVGFALERYYAVLRGHAWKDVPAAAIREGDWVRVKLQLNTRSMRRFVAITDIVPGGLRPADLELAGVSDAELRSLASEGSPYFPAHQIDDRYARFYSEQLPPGAHEIYYYARATHHGRYAALPAVAELMYGSASVSRTASANIEVTTSGPGQDAPPISRKHD